MVLILLPAYNEEESLPALFEKIEREMTHAGLDYKVLVCDDGSSDRTPELLQSYAQKLPLEVITHKINRGLGETSRDLFERAAEITDLGDVIIRLDCDDTHDPAFIPTMIEKLKEGYDVVTASRFKPGGGQVGVSPYRAFISRGANLFMKTFFPIKGLWEYSCGFRAYRARIIKKAVRFYGWRFIQLQGLGFTCTLEKLIKLKILGARFAGVPFVLRYDRKNSSSKMIGNITTLGYLVLVVLYHWPWGGWRRAEKKRLRRHHTRRQQRPAKDELPATS